MKKSLLHSSPPNASQGEGFSTTHSISQSALLSHVSRVKPSKIRAIKGMTQKELAEKMEISQNNISKMERNDDMLLSTLKKYIKSMDAEIEIVARIHGKVFLLDI